MSTKRKRIPSGCLFQKAYKDRRGDLQHSRTWYLKYYVHGRPVELPSGTEDYVGALAMLRKKVAAAEEIGQLVEHPERVRMGQLFDLLLNWYTLKGRRNTYDVKRKIEKKNGLRVWFGKMKPQEVGSKITSYIAWRRREKKPPQNSTINRELAYVRRAMKLGAEQKPPLVLRVPKFEMLPEADPREGIVSHETYRAVRDVLPVYVRIALMIGYYMGARKGEIMTILRDKVDLKALRIEIPRRRSKNNRPRFLPIYGPMAAEIEMALAAGDPKCPFLIQREGQPVQDFEKSWATACTLAGVPAALFHDLRRTALTNMIEAGWSEKEAMEVSGHRTRAVFDRYHIVSERRMKEISGRLDAHMRAKEEEAATNVPPERVN